MHNLLATWSDCDLIWVWFAEDLLHLQMQAEWQLLLALKYFEIMIGMVFFK